MSTFPFRISSLSVCLSVSPHGFTFVSAGFFLVMEDAALLERQSTVNYRVSEKKLGLS
jgi:hypothetical protein